MINKLYFGRRLASYRRKLGLSQSELAEMLGVTSQAVSKWECGNAIPDVDLLLELSHIYQASINEMLEGTDLIQSLTGHKTDSDGIAYFVPKKERLRNASWAEHMKKERWIEQNWKECQAENKKRAPIGKKIAEAGGVILEIGTGPGGGFMPYILKANPDASIIINDLSPTVVREWKRFLDKNLASPQLYYAVFDFCKMPFQDNSIDVISDGGGIDNCEADSAGGKAEALKEAYRVLKPGGMLVTSTGFVNKETFAKLPCDAKRILRERRPDIFEDLYEDTILAGFSKIDTAVIGEWYTETDESTIASLARQLGVNLKFTSYVRYCRKD